MKTVLTLFLCSTLASPAFARPGGGGSSSSSPSRSTSPSPAPRAASPVPSAGSRFGSNPSPLTTSRVGVSPVPRAGSSYFGNTMPSPAARSNPAALATPPKSARSTGGGGGGTSGGYRPTPLRLEFPTGRPVIARGSAAPNLADPTHPLHPYNPLNPVSPLSPSNPINRMDLNDDQGHAAFDKVLKIENDAGTLRAYQCLLAAGESDQAAPMEQDCVLLGVLTADHLDALVERKKACSELDGSDAAGLAVLAILGGAAGATGGALAAMAFDTSASYARVLALPAVATGVAFGVIGYFIGVDICREGIGLVARRLVAELNHDVPPDYARVLKVPDSTWTALDTILR